MDDILVLILVTGAIWGTLLAFSLFAYLEYRYSIEQKKSRPVARSIVHGLIMGSYGFIAGQLMIIAMPVLGPIIMLLFYKFDLRNRNIFRLY